MSEHTFPNSEAVRIALANVSEAAQRSLIEVRAGTTPDERVVVIEDAYDAELAAADQTQILPSEEDVRTEAARRLMETYEARDRNHLSQLINDGTREAVRLLRVGEGNWSPEEAARASELEIAEAYVDAIDQASKALRAMQPIPTDYAADGHWPLVPGA